MNKSDENYLVGDIGGTNLRFGLARRDNFGKISIGNICKMPNKKHPSLEAAIADYLATLTLKPIYAALAIAGPVKNGRAIMTNKHWSIGQDELQQKFGFERLYLYNDFAAMARAIPECGNADFKLLNDGVPAPMSPVLVAGPGTGFGAAILIPIKCKANIFWKIISTEAGHQAYAPQSRLETDILHILQKKYDFVSLELISSGSGMNVVHEAICQYFGYKYTQISPEDMHAKALGGNKICLEVCKIRANAIMGALGDLALACGARGGVVLAGGVAKNLIDFIDTPGALSRYLNRGVQKEYVKNIQVRLLKKPAAALYGLAALIMDEDNGQTI